MSKEGPVRYLFLFTDRYPYDMGEQFIANEVPFLSEKFNYIFSFPMKKVDHQKRTYPANLRPAYLFEDIRYNHWFEYLHNLHIIIYALLTEFLNTKFKLSFLKMFRTNLRILLNCVSMAEAIKRFMIRKKISRDAVSCYCYWFYDWAIALSVLKSMGVIDRFVSRAHLGDLYDKMTPGRLLPFHYYKIKSAEKIYPVSKHGRDYLVHNFPRFQEKFECRYLGVADSGLNPSGPSHVFTLVSCSSLTPRKRVDRLTEILRHIDFEIQWIHFGSGPEMDRIKNLADQLPPNIKTELKGYVLNDRMKEFYRTTPVDLFINVSEAEGIPVSLMEAASFGIPMMATDVYGNSEIVRDETGFLLQKDFDAREAASLIASFRNRKDIESLRKNVYLFYKQHFNDSENYTKFAEVLTGYVGKKGGSGK